MPRDGDRKEGGYQKYTLDQIADENFFVPASKIDAALAAKYDYVVVGTGPCSYSFIKKLVMSTKRDCQILVLERGGFFLPDHVQALDPVFGGMVGGIAETFPFIRAKEMTERDPAVYMHGPVNVVGGRSTVWTAWAPWPEVNDTANTNPTELRGFPVDHAAAVKVHKATAELYINADGKSNASIYKPDALPFSEGFVDHLNRTFNQQELDVYSNTEPDARILPHVTTKFNKAYLAPIAANRANSMNPFGKFTTTAPLLKLLKALVPQTPSDDTAAPFWKRKTVPSFLYVLYTTFLDIANFTVKSRDTGKTWTRRETVDCLAAIWSKWTEGVVAGQLSVPQGHTTHVAQQLFFDICQVYGNPFKVLTYPFSKYGKALLDIITPRQDTRADREKLGEAEVYFDMYAMGTFHYKKTKVDTFDYYINGDSNVLPNVSITCVVNACVTKLVNDSKTGSVSDIELLLNNRFNFNHCGEKSILCSNPDCGCTASETSANCSKRSLDCRGSRIVLGMGMYPAANLLMDSFPDDQSIGQDVGAHWCSSVVCRLPRDDGLRVLEKAIARGDPSVTAGLKAAFDGEDYSEAIYVTGYNEVSNGKTKIAANEWHSQLSVIIPSYTAGGRSIATLAAAVPGGPDSMVRTSDPDYVYFNFSNLGEAMTNEVENKLVEESGIEMDIRKNNYYRKDTSVPSEDIVLPGTRRDGGEGLLNIQLSKMDYTAWQKSVEMPVAIMEALFGNVKKTLSYYNKTTKQWLTAEDLHNAGSSDDAKYRLNKYADFSSMGMVHDGCVLQIDTDGNHNNGSVYSVGTAETHGKLPYQYKKASNVFITGSGSRGQRGSCCGGREAPIISRTNRRCLKGQASPQDPPSLYKLGPMISVAKLHRRNTF